MAFPLVQFPNAALIASLAASAVGRVTSGTTHDVASAVSRVALTIWALQELVSGTNWFRRVLGAAALVWIAVGVVG